MNVHHRHVNTALHVRITLTATHVHVSMVMMEHSAKQVTLCFFCLYLFVFRIRKSGLKKMSTHEYTMKGLKYEIKFYWLFLKVQCGFSKKDPMVKHSYNNNF